MNALGVGCALLLLFSNVPGVGEARRPVQPTQCFDVQLKLVEVGPNGERSYVDTRKFEVIAERMQKFFSGSPIPKKHSAIVRAAFFQPERSESSPTRKVKPHEAAFSWTINVMGESKGSAKVLLSLQRHKQPGIYYNGNLPAGKEFVVRDEVVAGQIQRYVLTRDDRGLPTSWIEVVVVPTDEEHAAASPRSEVMSPAQTMELCPFWYDPF